MATAKLWLEGARLRTLPASAAPVILGAAAGYYLGTGAIGSDFNTPANAGKSVMALLVALLLQIGVNYANDYSDGVRGTDEFRTGPARLTASGETSPKKVLAVALAFLGAAAIVGFALVAWTGTWWLLIPGGLALPVAWFYTGGKHPYGYMGLGEVFVFLYFGLMATVGTTWVLVQAAPWWVWLGASGMGLLSCALLMVNNIRDVPTDAQSGKRTLAVRLGAARARWAYVGMVFAAVFLALPVLGVGLLDSYAQTDLSLSKTGNTMMIVLTVVLALGATLLARPVLAGKQGRDLIVVLRNTGIYTLLYAVLLAASLVLTLS